MTTDRFGGGIDGGVQTRRVADHKRKLGEGDALRGVVLDIGPVEAFYNECLDLAIGVLDGDAGLRRVFFRLPEDVPRVVRGGDVGTARRRNPGRRAGEPGVAFFKRLRIDPATAMGDEGPVRRGNAAAPGAGRHPQPALGVRVRRVDRGEVLAGDIEGEGVGHGEIAVAVRRTADRAGHGGGAVDGMHGDLPLDRGRHPGEDREAGG